MTVTKNFAHWQETQPIFLESFKDSTVEIVWGNGDPLTSTILAQCILLPCVLMIFNIYHVEDQIYNLSHKYDSNRNYWIREQAQTHILAHNAIVIARQKYSTHDFLLIADTVSHKNRWHERPFLSLFVELSTQIPIKLPMVVILTIPKPGIISPDSIQGRVISVFVSSILIFVNLSSNSLYIGCFSCHENHKQIIEAIRFKPSDSITFEFLPKSSANSLKDIYLHWKSLHSHLFLGSEAKPDNCMTFSSYNEGLFPFPEETCQVYEEYFRYKNCSNFEACILFYTELLQISPKHSIGVHDSWRIFPFVQNQTDISLQILFPNIKFFDANLEAYLAPFKLDIWLCLLSSMIGFSAWLIWIEGQNFGRVAFIQFSIILEQNVEHLRTKRICGKSMLILWIYCSIFLRFFYTSSLYSLLTDDEVPIDYPQNMQELLLRRDFDVLLTDELFETIYWTFAGMDSYPPQQLEKFYIRVLKKAFFMTEDIGTSALQHILNGEAGEVWYFIEKNLTSVRALNNARHKTEYLKFHSFAIMCETANDESCSIFEPFSGNVRLYHVFLKESRFFSSNAFWSESSPSFVTIHFSEFLGSFVHSGLYELLVVRFRKLSETLKSLFYIGTAELEDGTLFKHYWADNVARTWNEGKNYCENRGLGVSLATVKSEEEVAVLKRAYGSSTFSGTYWISAGLAPPPNSMIWVDGINDTISYIGMPWRTNEVSMICGAFHSLASESYFQTVNCSSKYRVLCARTERRNTFPPTKPTTEPPTTEVPTKEPPTTEEPTTEPATTEEPTTEPGTTEEPPTTEEPTTEPGTTEEPTTEPPTTEEPTTEPPTTAEPTTEPGTTEETTTEPPTTEEPTTEPGTTEETSTEPPTTEEPTTEPGTTEEPTTEPGTTEEPTTEPGTTEEPTTEPPTTEEPTTEPGTTEEPTTEPPTTEEPTTEPGTTEEPTTEPPTTEEPTTEPGTTEEPTTEPGTTEEPTTEPGTTEELTTEPPTTEEPTTEPGTTEEPTTEPPTTEEPTTEPGTTEEPTTEPPTTEEPTTEPPTTEEPTTEPPTTEEPTTEPPTTAEPTTEPPTTEEPTTEPPTTAEPTTEPGTTEEPTTEAGTTEEPTTEPGTTEEPTTEPPTTEEPTTEPGTTEEPPREPPTTEEPTTEPGTTEEPTTEPPTTEEPTTEPPTTEEPTTEPPTTEEPTTEPGTTEIPTTEPATTEIPTTEPATTEIPTTEPATTEIPTTEPATTEPATTEPATTEPATTEIPTTEPATTEPPITELPPTEPSTTDVPTTEPPTSEVSTTETATTDAQTTEGAITEALTSKR
ncbi:unnamed protein product [Orchesella dallaii]|uniref:C-type lectin domain-containing protein n=1 Tax=Orchesella dallaii TaxID=48710 RepID=A0ABP1QV88_9HEXA